jgi:hypothetical protein
MAEPKSFVKNSTYAKARCIVLVAATNATNTGFDIAELVSWEDTYKDLQWNDPDGLAALDCKTGTFVEITYEGKKSKVWRIHDGTRVDINDAPGHVELICEKSGAFKPNTRRGPWYHREAEGSLTLGDYGFDNYQPKKTCKD